ncbi:PAS domain S-box protein [Candidatus Woesearchaeota archaeon]|nr:PAS domain S-box protein [Candidatus Woesearchaeota archaeon]
MDKPEKGRIRKDSDSNRRIKDVKHSRRKSKHASGNTVHASRNILNASDEFYISILKDMPIGIFRTTPGQNGKFVHTNKSFLKLFGFADESEVRNLPVSELYINKADRLALSKELVKKGYVAGYEVQLRKKDGHPLWCSITAKVVYDKDNHKITFFDGTIENVTDRKVAEELLREEEEKLRTVFQNMPDYFYRTDKNGKIILVSPSTLKMMGYKSSDEVAGKDMARDFYSNPYERRKFLRKLQKDGKVTDYEIDLVKKDRSVVTVSTNSCYYYDKDGRIAGVEGIFRDISKRKQAELKLIESNEKINALNRFNKSIIDGISDEVLVIEPNTRKIISANKEVLKRVGMSLSSIIGKRCYEFYNAHGRECDACALSKTLETMKKAECELNSYDPKNKRELFLNISTYPIFDSNRVIKQVVHITKDITEKKQNERTFAELNQRLLMLFKMSSNLQQSLDINDNIETAITAFESLGYDRVRIYKMVDNQLVGLKSNHMPDTEFRKIVVPFDDEHRRAYTCISARKPIIEKTTKKTRLSKVLGKTGVFESASLPLLCKEKCLGIISVDNKFSQKLISKDDLSILMIFANQIAVALENAILHKNDIIMLNKLRALYDISSTITSTLNLEKLLNMIVIKIVKLLKVDMCSIFFLDESSKKLSLAASFDIKNYKRDPKTMLSCDSPCGKALRTNKMVYIRSISSEKGYENAQFAEKAGLKSMLSIPMYIDGGPTGVINIFTRETKEFSADELDLLQSLSNHTSMIIRNSQLYERIKYDKDTLSTLVDISRSVSSTLNTDDLLELVLNKAIEFTGADFGFIMLIKNNYLEVKISEKHKIANAEHMKLKIGQGIPGHVAKYKMPEIVGDVTKDKRYIKILDNIRSMAVIPLLSHGEILGVIDLESTKVDNFKYIKKTLNILTNNISIALENARLYDKVSKFNVRLKTEVEIATQELRQKNIELLKLDELKSDFVSNVSHELRTPLTSINGYTKLLLMEKLGKLNQKQMQCLKIVSEEGDRLTRLINDVLDLSKLESGKAKVDIEKVDVALLANETIKTLSMSARENGILVNVVLKTNKTEIEASRDLIKQVYINLISNAIKFSSPGGKVMVVIKKVRKNISISVKDTGRGIPEEFIPKLFNKFVQFDSSMTREQGGTGLGLVIVKHILNVHNGKITVKSKLGKGSTFTFILPYKHIKKRDNITNDLAAAAMPGPIAASQLSD